MVAVPFCRCRVLYIGSAVPTITKDGLQGIQQPLRERYPVEETADTKGIDSWYSMHTHSAESPLNASMLIVRMTDKNNPIFTNHSTKRFH